MNKVNLCWVFSDGQKGHEIQSMTLAHLLANQVECYPFILRQPWLTFTPRQLPRFDLAIKWRNQLPANYAPDIIITTGRKAAAVGKHIKSKKQTPGHSIKHIQILNPKDNLRNYDLVLLPDHDNVKGKNVINFIGSIHPYDRQWFEQDKDESFNHYIAIFIGNPNKEYFRKEFTAEIQSIQTHFQESPLYFCGSPRLNPESKEIIQRIARIQDVIWLSDNEGANPYESLLKNAKKIFVTSDSINMMNEACSSPAPLSILARNFIPTPKHERYILSIDTRTNQFLDISKPKTTKSGNLQNQLVTEIEQILFNQ